ncbi:MAG: PAS domain S-box protein [Thermodesulfobacteriota bacterium]|nr:PAS domain S-box protein [Thermodesulfobacteriota bacterium]
MSRTPHILIVDDEFHMCESLNTLLKDEGYHTHTCLTGKDAIGYLARSSCDLVLLDMVMPDMDGLQVLRELGGKGLEPVVIVMSGHASVESAVQALRGGAYDYLKKPFEHEELLRTVGNALGQKRLEEEHKEVERALRESEGKYSTLVENSLIGICIDQDDRIVFANKKFAKIYGYSMGELIGMESWKLVHPEDRALVDEMRRKGLGGDETPSQYEAWGVTKDGERVWITRRNTSIEYQGRPAVLGNVADASKRRLAEEALREAEERYRTVLEACPDPIVAYDMDGKVVYLNPAFAHVFGWSPGELVGKEIDYVPQENWPETQRMIDRVLAGESFSGIKSRRYTKQGSVLDVSISVATYLDGHGSPVGSIHTLRDVTERNRLEAQVQHAQKLEAVGTLAGGIAHDFNNLLMAVQGNVSLMLMDLDPRHPHNERLENIEKQIQSGARLTSHLLAYARKGKYEVKPVDLNEIVESTAYTFGRTKKEITIHPELFEEPLTIEADPRQIEQVLFNLLVNASDAMPSGGALVLRTRNATHNDIKGKVYNPKPGNYVLLEVGDTGIGMDEETMERIFDPFFTTKDMGHGTGLGLASAYGIVKGHGGYIEIDSKKGDGATFSIYFPASEKQVESAVKTADGFMRGTETVLLVDDEAAVLEVGMKLLGVMGYHVLTARDGNEALAVYETHGADIDIILLDMVMPNMGGGEAYDRMKEINPRIKVLLSSGYSIDGRAQEILDRGCNGFIQKPFDMKQLSARLREILDAP